jgi:hypothetical protein
MPNIGAIIGAAFTHEAARPTKDAPDPQLHTRGASLIDAVLKLPPGRGRDVDQHFVGVGLLALQSLLMIQRR